MPSGIGILKSTGMLILWECLCRLMFDFIELAKKKANNLFIKLFIFLWSDLRRPLALPVPVRPPYATPANLCDN